MDSKQDGKSDGNRSLQQARGQHLPRPGSPHPPVTAHVDHVKLRAFELNKVYHFRWYKSPASILLFAKVYTR